MLERSTFLACGKLIGVRHDDLDPKEQQRVSTWAETRVGGEMRRAGIEKRFAPRKIEIAVERFEVNPSKPELVRFLNAHADERCALCGFRWA